MTEPLAEFRPDWVSPPGDTIADLLEEHGWSQVQFAERIGYTPKHVNQLIRGKASITEDTAVRLERVLGSTAQFWLAREAQYRGSLARAAQRAELKSCVSWLNEIPIKHMIKYKWIRDCDDKVDLVAECLRFFGVASLEAWRATYERPLVESYAAFRSSEKFEKKPGPVAAWLRYGEREAAGIQCKPFDRTAFVNELHNLRALTTQPDPEVFVGRLREVCSAVGVAVVFAPAPPGCPVAGATKWLTPEKALLMLSLRYKTNDSLWFAFFHEAAHLLLHGKKLLFLENLGGLDAEAEAEANKFAADILIPPSAAQMLRYLSHTYAAVSDFADSIGVAPGIVVGRMQHEGLLPRSYLNHLKVRYTWSV